METELILRLSFAGTAIFIGLILGIALLTSKKTNNHVNLLLFVIIVFFIGQAMDSFLMYTSLYNNFPHIVLTVIPIGLLIGAVYYFYIRIILEPTFRFRWYDGIHLILVAAKYYKGQSFYILPSEKKIEKLKYLWFDNPNKPNFFSFLRWSQDEFLTIFYLVATIKLINLALKSLKSKSANTDIEYLVWLKKSTYIFIGLSILEIIRTFVVIQFNFDAGKSEIISSVILLTYIIYLIFQMIQNPNRAFYKLNTEITVINKNNFNFKIRKDIFAKNITRIFTKRRTINHNILITITGIILITSIYFYFFNSTNNWYYFIAAILLYFIIFQFTIIDNQIIYPAFKAYDIEFTGLELKTKDDFNIEISTKDSDFILSLKNIMENQQPYLNSNLKSHELANLLETTPHYLSKKINKELNQNFYNFINSYRIDDFKKRILQEEHKNFTLNSIAKDVGFNSKSSFNRIFKAMEGITPSEYVKTQKKVSTLSDDTSQA